MTDTVMTAADIDAATLAAMQDQKDQTSRTDTVVRIDQVGEYRIRILPNNMAKDPTNFAWSRPFAMHFWKKGLIGNEKTIIFNSAKHTLGLEKDPIITAVDRAKQSGNPALEAMADLIRSGASYVVNAMILQPGETVGDVIALQLNKTTWDNFVSFGRLVMAGFTYLNTNICLTVEFKKFPNGNGIFGEVVAREEPVDLTAIGITPEMLYDLDDVVTEKTANARHPDSFTGDLLSPVAAVAAALPAIGVAPALAAPVVAAVAPPALPAPVASPIVESAPVTIPPAAEVVAAPPPVATAPAAPAPTAPVPASPVAAPVVEATAEVVAPAAEAPVAPAEPDVVKTQAQIDAELAEMLGKSDGPLASVT